MIFFFDRNTGTSIPQALQLLNPPHAVEYHQKHFAQTEPDDQWLAVVGAWDWIVIAQDYKFHLRPHELAAIRQHNVGVIYLWGAGAKRWDTARVFLKAFDTIVLACETTAKPFVYRVLKDGRLKRVTLL